MQCGKAATKGARTALSASLAPLSDGRAQGCPRSEDRRAPQRFGQILIQKYGRKKAQEAQEPRYFCVFRAFLRPIRFRGLSAMVEPAQ